MGEQYDFDEEKFRYAYLSHDMTKAYDKETVDEVTRTMLAVMTENESFPMVYVIYDRILADSPSYKKTFLLHAQEKPTITSDGVIVVTNDGGGQLVAQSCVTETDAVVFGGDGEEYRIGKKVYLPSSYDKSNPEYRIEISPIIETKRDDLVTVMYVCDEGQEILRADSFEDDTFVGATILNTAALFVKDCQRLGQAATITVTGSGELQYFISGMEAGEWSVTVNDTTIGTFEVTEEGGLLTFTADAGEIEFQKIK